MTDKEWLAQCALTETKKPHEWTAVLWVIRNRMESPRFPDSAYRVVTQPFQFSAYNSLPSHGSENARFRSMQSRLGATPETWKRALETAGEVLEGCPENSPVGDAVLFWSPRSMAPRWTFPKWNWGEVRIFSLPEIDPRRFLFATYV